MMQTRLHEDFTLGITDSTLNAVCLNSSGDPQDLPTVTNPAQCAGLGFVANPGFNSYLQPLDLTRGGTPFQFTGAENINEYAGLHSGCHYPRQSRAHARPAHRPVQWRRYRGHGSGAPHWHFLPHRRNRHDPACGICANDGNAIQRKSSGGDFSGFLSIDSQPSPRKAERRSGRAIATNIISVSNRLWAITFYLDADYFWKYTDNAYDFGRALQ